LPYRICKRPSEHDTSVSFGVRLSVPVPLVCRSVRVAPVSGAIGMLIGAVAILSLLDKRLAQTSSSDQTAAFAQGDQNDAEVDKFPISANSNGLPSKDVALSLPEDCRKSARSFFDRSCRFVRKHKLGGARSPGRLETAGIDRNGPVGGALEQEAAAIDVGSMPANAGRRQEAAAASTHVLVPAEKSTKIARARQIRLFRARVALTLLPPHRLVSSGINIRTCLGVTLISTQSRGDGRGDVANARRRTAVAGALHRHVHAHAMDCQHRKLLRSGMQ